MEDCCKSNTATALLPASWNQPHGPANPHPPQAVLSHHTASSSPVKAVKAAKTSHTSTSLSTVPSFLSLCVPSPAPSPKLPANSTSRGPVIWSHLTLPQPLPCFHSLVPMHISMFQSFWDVPMYPACLMPSLDSHHLSPSSWIYWSHPIAGPINGCSPLIPYPGNVNTLQLACTLLAPMNSPALPFSNLKQP